MSTATPAPVPTPYVAATPAMESDAPPTIQNVVCTVTLGVPLDLLEISQKARNTEYNPKRFAAVIMRTRSPQATALIFASGKMVVTGTKSLEDAQKATQDFMKIIKKINSTKYKDMVQKDFKVQNIVASADVKFPIRLERLSLDAETPLAQYEPECFPGLIYRMVSPRVVFLIFVSGKVVITGAKTTEDIHKAHKNMLGILKLYRKDVS